jgi:hypothetical protein
MEQQPFLAGRFANAMVRAGMVVCPVSMPALSTQPMIWQSNKSITVVFLPFLSVYLTGIGPAANYKQLV